MEAQCKYHSQSKELFETIKNNWGQGTNSDSCDVMSKVMIRNEPAVSLQQSIPAEEATSKIRFRPTSMRQHSPASSSDDYNTSTYSSESVVQSTVPTRVPPPTNLPSRQTSTHDFDKYRKALFDFTGQNDDEISFKTGDVITVIDEIDKGWWLGEAHSKRGIFPVNYTEDYDLHAQPLPPLPPASSDSPPPPPPAAATVADILSEPTMAPQTRQPPISSQASLSRKRSTAIRAPPPPPAARANSLESSPSLKSTVHDIHTSHFLQETHHDQHLVHEEPSSYIKSTPSSLHSQEPLASLSSSPRLSRLLGDQLHQIDSPPVDICGECDCHELIENLFKKGYCNGCFHRH